MILNLGRPSVTFFKGGDFDLLLRLTGRNGIDAYQPRLARSCLFRLRTTRAANQIAPIFVC
jgi:hypothetical protein